MEIIDMQLETTPETTIIHACRSGHKKTVTIMLSNA